MGGRLDAKVAVVTGGASGIGLASVERFLAEGARVVFCDLPAQPHQVLQERFGETAAGMHRRDRARDGAHDGQSIAQRLGPNAHFVAADVSDAAQFAAVFQAAVDRFGGLDILFNNAGVVAREGLIADCAEEVYDHIVAINLKAVWRGIKLATPHMIARGGGSIINCASVAGLAGFPGMGAYASSKGGVIALTRAAAVELAGHGIRVNAVAPGSIATPIGRPDDDYDLDELRKGIARIPTLARAGEPSDIAAAALFFACEDSSFVTGQTLTVDGGSISEYDARIRGAMSQPQPQPS